MKPSEIIKLARRQTWCTEDIVTPEEAARFLNFVIEDFGAEIRASDSWYWFDVLDIDVTAWQPSYTFESDEETGVYSQKFPISKIQSVWLLDQNTWKYRDLPVHFVDKVDVNKFADPWEPRACFITRKEINLIPAPKTSTNMQIWGWNYNFELPYAYTVTSQDANIVRYRAPEWDEPWKTHPYAWNREDFPTSFWYTDSPTPAVWDTIYDDHTSPVFSFPITAVGMAYEYDNEESIWIDKRWHYVLVEWLKYWMYWNMWVNFETARANSRAFYDNEKNKAIQNIVDRWQLADTAYFPDLNFLNY